MRSVHVHHYVGPGGSNVITLIHGNNGTRGVQKSCCNFIELFYINFILMMESK
jgi:hypothetical protein